jgi:hypothetical protein
MSHVTTGIHEVVRLVLTPIKRFEGGDRHPEFFSRELVAEQADGSRVLVTLFADSESGLGLIEEHNHA